MSQIVINRPLDDAHTGLALPRPGCTHPGPSSGLCKHSRGTGSMEGVCGRGLQICIRKADCIKTQGIADITPMEVCGKGLGG